MLKPDILMLSSTPFLNKYVTLHPLDNRRNEFTISSVAVLVCVIFTPILVSYATLTPISKLLYSFPITSFEYEVFPVNLVLLDR